MKIPHATILSCLFSLCMLGCEDTESSKSNASPAEVSESDAKGNKESSESDKYTIGGRIRPAWVETLKLVTESLSLTTSGKELHRASKLALAASELAAEHPHLLGYTELTLAFTELRLGKIESFERLMVRGLGRVPPDARHTEVALMAAEQSVRRGRLDPSRVMLGLWRKRLDKAGEKELTEKVDKRADEHLQRIRGKPEKKAEKPKFEAPPSDFPIVLPN